MTDSLNCFFVSDLHGKLDRYEKLFKQMMAESPNALFIAGDILPSPFAALTALDIAHEDFINGFLVKEFGKIKEDLGDKYPDVFVILGNDDGRMEEAALLDAAACGVWQYCHNRRIRWNEFSVYGYSYIPPTPFRLKDWERYDVSRYVDPGCISPEEGMRSIPVSEYQLKFGTIAEDLDKLVGEDNLEKSIFLFHSPPYKCKLDRAALDGKMIDYAPLDVHIGSIAIQRFIEEKQPLLTLHGHVHESTRLTGSWQDRFKRTISFNAAHDGPELSLVRFDPLRPEYATRELI
ncbi:MAG: metallophosphoesterase [Candidatus Aminicenantes bacterium]|nr:metallophosphoesterase [Candidatus Aminicenantes bacterium]